MRTNIFAINKMNFVDILQSLLLIFSFVLGFVSVILLINLFLSWFYPQTIYFKHFIDNELLDLLINTALLVFFVGFLSTFIGLLLSLLFCFFSFPGQKFAAFLGFIPLAIPPYINGFIVLDVFDHGSVINSFLANFLNISGWDPSGFDGLSLVLIMSLYPYSFLLCRNALSGLDSKIIEASLTLDHSYIKIFFRLVIPLLASTLLSALFIILVEVLSDYATVSLFSFDTLATAIFKSWLGFFDLKSAMKVSTILLIISLLLFCFCRSFDFSRSRWHVPTDSSMPIDSIKKIILPRKYRFLLSFIVFAVLSIPSVLPVICLVCMFFKQDSYILSFETLLNSILLAFVVSCLIIILSLNLLSLKRLGTFMNNIFQKVSRYFQVINFGYIVPSTVLAIAIYSFFIYFSRLFFDYFSINFVGYTVDLLLLVIAMTIHFYAVGYGVISDGYEKLSVKLDESAKTLGSHKFKIFYGIHLPLLKKPMQLAAMLLCLDVIKDIPMSLMLRPIGFNTLSVKIYELSSEGLWYKAASPSLILVAISVVLLTIVYFHYPKYLNRS